MASVTPELSILIEEVHAETVKLLTAKSLLGKADSDRLLDKIVTLKEIIQTLNLNINTLSNQSIIDTLGLGDNIIYLRDSGNDFRAISKVLSTQTGRIISANEVQNWLESYDSASLLKNPRGTIGSVFDTRSVMENLFMELYAHLEKVKKEDDKKFADARTTRSQVELDIYKEIRHLTKDAAAIIESISNMQRYKEFQRLVIESIDEVSPEAKQQIMRKLKDQKALFNSLMPN